MSTSSSLTATIREPSPLTSSTRPSTLPASPESSKAAPARIRRPGLVSACQTPLSRRWSSSSSTLPPGSGAPSSDPRREDTAVVEDEHVAGAEVARQIVETAVGDAAVQPREHHETRVVPGLDRGLGDQTLRQVVVEVAGLQSAGWSLVRVLCAASQRRRNMAAAHSLAMRAAARVLCRSMAIVIGPTPPGTGVMAAAFSDTASKSTSPTRR